MRIEDTRVYVGPNLWAFFPVIRMSVDLGVLEKWPTGRLGEEFQQGLLSALPGLKNHRCSYGEPGGFVRRLTEDEGTWLGHVLEHVSIELQNEAGFPVKFGRARSVSGRPGVYDVVYEYGEREVGLAAGRLAFDLIASLLPPALRATTTGPALDYPAAQAAFLDLAAGKRLGPSTAALVRAAMDRRIPWERLDGDHLIQLGYGVKQRRVQGALTSRTSELGVEIASDKSLTNRLLDSIGIPVPAQARVRTEEEAVAAAERLGYPVVVKPLDANHGRGVHPGIENAADVRAAFHDAWEEGSGVLVEEHIDGFDYRLLVVDGKLVAAAHRIPACVIGDGKSTVRDLVDRVNADPRRGEGHDNVLTRIELDDEADRMLARRGYGRDSVPSAGEIVQLRVTANLSRGATATDVTDRVHPDNTMLAVRAARALGLDVAGVDFLTTDISRSYLEVGGGVCELNAAPGLRMHVAPSEGEARDVAGPIMDHLFPDGETGRIPIAAITGTNGKTTTAKMVAHIAAGAGRHVGLATTTGVYIDGRMVAPGDTTGPASARLVLRDATVDCAVLETARGGILREGLAFRYCSVGAVLNVTADHLGLGGIHTVEELGEVKKTVVEVATDVAVLNADDPICYSMIGDSSAKRICLVSMHGCERTVRDHVSRGGLAVVLEDGPDAKLVAYDGEVRQPLASVSTIPATVGGKVRFNIENSLFAAAIAYGLGIETEDIREGLQSFVPDFQQSPGRLNIHDGLPFRVIVDYGHNPAAVRAMCDAAGRLSNGGRLICVLAAPGDRRDEDIRETARAAAGQCDLYICRRDDSLRGRGTDEVPRILRDGLIAAGVSPERIRIVPAEEEATLAGLREAREGDLLLLFADELERTWRQVMAFTPLLRTTGRPAPELPRRPRYALPGRTLVRM